MPRTAVPDIRTGKVNCTKRVRRRIIEAIAGGSSLRAACAGIGLDHSTYLGWVRTKPEVATEYREALAARNASLEADIVELPDAIPPGSSMSDVQAVRQQVESRKWLLSVSDPLRYSEKHQIALAVQNQNAPDGTPDGQAPNTPWGRLEEELGKIEHDPTPQPPAPPPESDAEKAERLRREAAADRRQAAAKEANANRLAPKPARVPEERRLTAFAAPDGFPHDEKPPPKEPDDVLPPEKPKEKPHPWHSASREEWLEMTGETWGGRR